MLAMVGLDFFVFLVGASRSEYIGRNRRNRREADRDEPKVPCKWVKLPNISPKMGNLR